MELVCVKPVDDLENVSSSEGSPPTSPTKGILKNPQQQPAAKDLPTDYKNNIFSKRKLFKRQNSILFSVGYENLVNDELELKIALYNHICSPLKRWKIGRIVPIKLIMQVVKTLLVLTQVFLFAYTLANERAFFLIDSKEVLQHLLLKNEGKVQSLYTKQQIIEELTFTVSNYYQLPNIALGRYGHQIDTNGSIQPIVATLRQYRQADINPSSDSIVLDQTISTTTMNLTEADAWLQLTEDLNWDGFIGLSLLIQLKNVHIVKNPDSIDCHLLTITIDFSNAKYSGIIVHSLEVNKLEHTDCNTQILNQDEVFRTLIDMLLIIICITSTVFAVMKYWRAYKLAKAMGKFYRDKLEIKLSWKERRPLFSLWLFFTIISNVFLILGSVFEICLEFNVTDFKSISVRFLLGSAVLIEAGTILRYISFFKQLNALPRTLSYVMPDLLKFLLCTSVLFFAFSICGSIIFAPFNERFSDFPNSLQSLFVLTNGDDIYPMFRSFDSTDNLAVKVYGQIFIYVFVALFVYAVLNLFTSLIINAHEQSQVVNRATVNEVRKFVYSGPLTETGQALCDHFEVHKFVDPEEIIKRKSHETII